MGNHNPPAYRIRRYQATWPHAHSVEELIPNLDYRSPEDNQRRIFEESALMGMRGDYQLLLGFKGEKFHEKIEFHNTWYDLVEHYSGRNLSHERDRLLAIAGVAAIISQRSGHTFVAGLWQENMKLDLLWSFKPNSPPRPRPRCRAPSWSWASASDAIESRLRPLFLDGGKGKLAG